MFAIVDKETLLVTKKMVQDHGKPTGPVLKDKIEKVPNQDNHILRLVIK